MVFKSPCYNKVFINKKNKKINTLFWERPEQYFITKYIDKNDCVLELGPRYGISSYCIQNKLKNKSLHVLVEPDEEIIYFLKKNIITNNMKCTLFNGILDIKPKCIYKSGLSTYTYENDEDKCNFINFQSIENLEVNKKFDTLVVDCEGCFINLFNNFREYILKNIKKIIIENDRLDHTYVFKELLLNDFKIIDNYFNHILVFKKI